MDDVLRNRLAEQAVFRAYHNNVAEDVRQDADLVVGRVVVQAVSLLDVAVEQDVRRIVGRGSIRSFTVWTG